MMNDSVYSNMQQNNKIIGLFLHYQDGTSVNIQDLPKDEYEKFLESMNNLRIAYITLTNDKNKKS